MKKDIHPVSYPVVFIDITCGARFVTRSTMKSDKVELIDGVEHFVHAISVSAESHPFYTGKSTFVDTEGRIDKFTKRFGDSALRRAGKPKLEKLGS
ncbi:type B 50S ribosomal protein L31 [Phragmitibacter flavus]|uniref:50S ribosomal protein L31 n=1 Tax=Phragmitibacter flavus TaxID=2576071 RepID=A0A5R8KIT2_9BACT|nr:type B 50S ribosomal protein L31 [Phragmitibacter flavus]TLD72167.1 type B 50S ribosomal protein L31 [Phragmitibacter flavus]